jgi:AcrR family transcriptional regulator
MTERGRSQARRGRPAPRARHLGPDVRRPLILDAALPLFAREGYDAVSMQRVADAAAVSKPVLYSCFQSKEELFDALLRREDRRLWDLVSSAIPDDDSADSEERRLRVTLTALLTAVEEMPDAFRVLYVQAGGEDRIERGRAHWHARMQEIVAQRSDRPAREAAVLARLLVAGAELGFSVMLDREGEWEPGELAEFLARTAIHGMRATAESA